MTKSLFISVLDDTIEDERREVEALALEIDRRGSKWAAEEIIRLRKRSAALASKA